jgi:hypothetical protein
MKILIDNNRVKIINQIVTDEFEGMVFDAADIVWLGYKNHFTSSGVLNLAAINRKVIIATNQGMIGWLTKEKNLGITVDIQDINSIKNAIIELSNDSNRSLYLFDTKNKDRSLLQGRLVEIETKDEDTQEKEKISYKIWHSGSEKNVKINNLLALYSWS